MDLRYQPTNPTDDRDRPFIYPPPSWHGRPACAIDRFKKSDRPVNSRIYSSLLLVL
ncbi:hypothetical protein [Microcoleus sp. OTE_8_concoct_300]|uniref:hypothetical protein n=1 Tax=Microcoleus sp. OTE_8_concoct_300 TaxID=2964710 RepID=UPI00403F4516